MNAVADITVKPWSGLTTTEVYALAHLRTEVFCIEQECSETELDWVDLEPTTAHFFVVDAASPKLRSYLRTLRTPWDEGGVSGDLVIGRVATDPGWRGHGLAGQLTDAVVARSGGEPMMLHAQTYAAGLYAKSGFVPVGEEFDEGGIPHITMVRPAD
ncbi:GNAT family N-acetyltransferase [uncultured Corynebacterium sp.]|uniref:GNAT family N-acetyltransferase n=1 Tax=uncultured Corynebacterium sp. TaxID=159447 RepID=UPI0025FAC5D8|nr:GNAT family N-acetyltransferase [uncultured Corynebacterium sp.]